MQDLDRENIRARVEKRLKGRKTAVRWVMFIMSVVFFLLFMGIAWGVSMSDPAFAQAFATEDSPLVLALIMPTIGGLMMLMFHMISLVLDSSASEKQMRAQILAEELSTSLLEEQLERAEAAQKRKRLSDEPMTVGEDGELIPLDEDDQARHQR